MSIQQAFNTAATEYDKLRRTLIPCFDDFYQTAIQVIPFDRTAALNVLDLGAGTGLYSGMVQAVFPNAEFTLLDLATEMLEQAKARFQQMGKSPKIWIGDYVKTDLSDSYDLIISGLSIHHLSDSEKQHLYQRIYDALKPGGMFINADQVLGRTPQLEQFYQQQWLNTVRDRGISEEHLHAAQHRMTYDRLAPLDAQIQWLEAAGFQNVDCWYKHYSFAVFGGSRSAESESEIQPPTIQTQRLTLRPFTLADAPDVQRFASAREIADTTLIPHPYEDGMAQAWIKAHLAAFKEKKAITQAIALRETGELCGTVNLMINAKQNNAEMGYWIGKPYWGQGYCTEAAKALLQYGFEELKLHRIHASHFSRNPGSGRVMQKLGMQYEGCLRQHLRKGETLEDIEQYGILKSDWQQMIGQNY
ncbi:GNAT family N-acetyltransferase [Trichocoleus sp. Lan]|uniref:GNAT family N-acetyltransferase n=1 Tax=Trichocoleus sp. Lan TaxID=2933927 RepID=UPI0032991099